MLVPVLGGVAALQKRNRQIFAQRAALSTVAIPDVYIFNVGPRVWRGVGGGKEWVIPACKKGERYSEGVAIPMLNLSEIDLADGGNNLSVVIDPALSGVQDQGDQQKQVDGVADDIIGKNSTSKGLTINTTNGEWFGVFASRSEEPSEEELLEAEDKLRQMDQLIYAQGAEKVQAGEKVQIIDRALYNGAAARLGAKSLWGTLDHTMDNCPECGEDIRKGANFCKHCQQAIDAVSVEARRRAREKEAAALLKEEGRDESGEAVGVPAAPVKSRDSRKRPRAS